MRRANWIWSEKAECGAREKRRTAGERRTVAVASTVPMQRALEPKWSPRPAPPALLNPHHDTPVSFTIDPAALPLEETWRERL